MKDFIGHLRAHIHLLLAALLGLVVGLVWPDIHTGVGRWLLGWNVGTWTYLFWTGWQMAHSDQSDVKRVAQAQAESAGTVLAIVGLAAIASFIAIIAELSEAKAGGGHHGELPHVLATLTTVAGSWLLVPTMFSLNYATLYHVTTSQDGGLNFPDTGKDFEPDYSDFLYFSFTIAVASQTSDVTVTNRSTRRLVLLQSVLSFVFNTTILAFAINIAASLL
jgi:uncharacterized membrane protein